MNEALAAPIRTRLQRHAGNDLPDAIVIFAGLLGLRRQVWPLFELIRGRLERLRGLLIGTRAADLDREDPEEAGEYYDRIRQVISGVTLHASPDGSGQRFVHARGEAALTDQEFISTLYGIFQ